MQFFLYFTMKEGEQGPQPPSPEAMAEMGRFTQEAVEAGRVPATGQLKGTTHVQLVDGKVSATDGPFIEGKELIPGFTIFRVDSKQEAIDIAAKHCEWLGMDVRIAQVAGPTD